MNNAKIKGTLTAPNISTYKIKSSDKNNWIDLEGKAHIYKECNIDEPLTVKKINTEDLYSTQENNWIDIHSYVHIYKSLDVDKNINN